MPPAPSNPAPSSDSDTESRPATGEKRGFVNLLDRERQEEAEKETNL